MPGTDEGRKERHAPVRGKAASVVARVAIRFIDEEQKGLEGPS